MMQNIKQDPIRLVRGLVIIYFISYILISVISHITLVELMSSFSDTSVKLFDLNLMVRDIVNLISPILFAFYAFMYYGKPVGRPFLVGAYALSLIQSVRSCLSITGLLMNSESSFLRQNIISTVMTIAGAVLCLLMLICVIKGEKGIKTAKTVVAFQLGHRILHLMYNVIALVIIAASEDIGLYSYVQIIKGAVVPLILMTAYFIYWRYAAERERELISDSDEKTVAL